MRRSKITVGVVILNYNSHAECARAIRDIKRQRGVELEIIVVDNNSRHDERKSIAELSAKERVTYIANDVNSGYNAGNNIGLRHAISRGYRYALIANPDMEFPAQDYIITLLRVMERDEEIALCAGSIITPSGTPQNPPRGCESGGIDDFGWLRNSLRRRSTALHPCWVDEPHRSRFCKKLNGCCILLRLASIERIGLFDERTFLYGEESILAKQIERAGQKIYYCAQTYAIHNHIESKEGDSSFRLKYWRQSQLLYLRYYSGYPPIRKLYSYLSIETYFLLMRVRAYLRKHHGANIKKRDH
ncbi:MAG: glycosyltransferase family 2 protein [Rikenellaceae bacterium]